MFSFRKLYFPEKDMLISVDLQSWSVKCSRVLFVKLRFILDTISPRKRLGSLISTRGHLQMAIAALLQASCVLLECSLACFELCFDDSP